MVRFIPAPELKNKYDVLGHFYSVEIAPTRVVACRSVLSDLRCSKSGEFFKQFKELEEAASCDSHSIFSMRRKDELALKLTKHIAIPVICAWGVSEALDPLIERCISSLTKHKTIRGLLKDGTANKYLHPLPSLQKQKVSWVNRMVEQCQ